MADPSKRPARMDPLPLREPTVPAHLITPAKPGTDLLRRVRDALMAYTFEPPKR
jgi:hypothetical protein